MCEITKVYCHPQLTLKTKIKIFMTLMSILFICLFLCSMFAIFACFNLKKKLSVNYFNNVMAQTTDVLKILSRIFKLLFISVYEFLNKY